MSKNIPKLRFPEFIGAPEWEEKSLHKTANFVNKKIPLSSLDGKKYISTENILQDFAGFKKTNTLPPAGSATEFRAGDILVSNIRPYLKKIWVADFEGGASNDVIVIRASENINQQFLSYNLKNDAFIDFVMAGAKGVKMPRGDIALIKQYPLFVPHEQNEQKKIADCLTSLDDLITAQSQKAQALKEHKNAMMKQLFPSEEESVPKLRFPAFKDKYQSKKVAECFDNFGGTALEKYTVNDGNYNFISIGNYSKDGKYIDKGQRVELNEITRSKLLNKNDLVMVLNDKTLSGDIIGATLLIYENDKYIYNQRSERLVVKSDLIPLYAWYMLNSDMIRKKVFKMSQGGTQIYVNFSSVKTIKAYFPCPKEQQKIADCLNSIDELITSQTAKVQVLKEHKKALMQQLFPNKPIKDN